jgi:transposase
VDIHRENDVEQLRRIALTQQSEIRRLLDALQSKCNTIDELRGESGELQHTLDALNEQQARQDEKSRKEPKTDGKTRRKRKQRGHGPKEQPKLERTEELFVLDEPDKACPNCGGELTPLAGQYESSELVDVVEVSYRLVDVKRQKYACRCGGCVETALGPERAIDGGRYSLSFAIKVAIDKYVDHLPLTRQARIMKRWGLELGSQTLWDQLVALAALLRPCYDALYKKMLSSPVIGLDQTSWKRLNKKGATPWQMWCLTTPSVIYHRICEDKSAKSWNALLGDFSGVVVCDAMATHGAKECNKPGPSLAGCWAHVFRKYEEAEPNFPEAAIAMAMIGELYEIDARARDPAHLLELRRTQSRAVLDRLQTWLLEQTTLKTTSLGNAIRYTYGNWPRLTLFVNDPNIPLDNNRTERGIRGPVVGRKNHYGSKSKRGTEVAAIFYSLIETAKLIGIEPAEYLAQAAVAARRGDVLLPHQLAD